MLSLLIAFALTQDPATLGPAGPSGGPVDYTQALFLTAPTLAQQCTNGAYTMDTGGAITVSRAESVWCEKQDGTIVVIGANKPVVEAAGLRIEPAGVNRLAFSTDIDLNWTPTNATAGSSPDIVNDIQTTAAGGFYASAAFTITGTSAILSAWLQNFGAGTATLVLRDTTAGVDRCTISVTSGTTYPTTMAGRQKCTSSSITSGNSHVVRAYPGGAAGSGNAYYVRNVGVDQGTTALTSHIPTNGAAASRSGDVITTTISDNSAGGCAGVTVKAVAPNFPQRVLTKSADVLVLNTTTQIFTGDGTNTVFTGGGVSDMTGRTVPMRAQWSGSALSASLDTVGTGSGSFDGSMGSGTTLYIGSNAGSQQLNGWIQKLKVSTSPTGCTP